MENEKTTTTNRFTKKNTTMIIVMVAGMALLFSGIHAAFGVSRSFADREPGLYSQLQSAVGNLQLAAAEAHDVVALTTGGTAADDSAGSGDTDSEGWNLWVRDLVDVNPGGRYLAADQESVATELALLQNYTNFESEADAALGATIGSDTVAKQSDSVVSVSQVNDMLSQASVLTNSILSATTDVLETFVQAVENDVVTQRDAVKAELDKALEASRQLMASTDGKVLDNATRVSLQAEIDEAAAIQVVQKADKQTKTSAIVDEQRKLSDAGSKLETLSSAVTQSNSAWQAEQDRIASQAAAAAAKNSSAKKSTSSSSAKKSGTSSGKKSGGTSSSSGGSGSSSSSSGSGGGGSSAGYGANRLVIPALGINGGFSSNGIVNGSLVIPSNPYALTLFSGGGQPCGTAGTVLIAGHVTWNGKHGTLYSLGSLGVGAEAIVTCGDGTITKWRATSKVETPKEKQPSGIWSAKGPRKLAVITCAGEPINGRYPNNVTVFFNPE
jgi:hypothetical protein